MKSQYTDLVEFSKEVDRREWAKGDFLVPSQELRLAVDNNTFRFGGRSAVANNHFHNQVSSRLGIPADYYARIGEIPALRAYNVNALLDQRGDERRLVRTLDGTARAYLSDSYKPIDNAFVLSAFLPALRDDPRLKKMEVHAASLTDRRMYLQLSFPGVEGEVRKGDVVRAGTVLSNSEVGVGAYDVSEFEWRLACLNGAVYSSLIRKTHVGRRIGDNEEDYSIYSDEAIAKELEAFKLRIRDTLLNFLSVGEFQKRLERLQIAAGQQIEKPVQTVEVVTKRFGLTKTEGEQIFQNIDSERDYTRFGLLNGITALARELEDRDRAFELERLGGKIITLSSSEWKTVVAEAAA